MRALLVLSLVLTACVDLDRYAPLDPILFAPLEQLLTNDHIDPSREPIRAFQLADVDGDGAEDLVNANNDNSISVHLAGPRPGSLFDPNEARSDPANTLPDSQILARDLDGDGAAELIVAGVDAWKWDVSALRPKAFHAFSPEVFASAGAFGSAEDAVAELWYERFTSDLRVDRWDGAHFVMVASAAVGDGSATTKVRAADLDGDGTLDVVVHDHSGSPQLRVFWGGLASIDGGDLITCESSVTSHLLVDVDNDGRVDVLTITPTQLFWCQSLPGHVFGPPGLITPLNSESAVAVADFDRDRLPDLIVKGANDKAPNCRVLRNTGGAFDATRDPISLPGAPDIAPFHRTQIIGRDLDGDGKVDIVVWAYDGLFWLRNESP